MNEWVFVIGSTDDFSSPEDLNGAYENGTIGDYNASFFEFDLPAGSGSDLHEADIATYVGRGMAFSNGWCMDDTISFVIRK